LKKNKKNKKVLKINPPSIITFGTSEISLKSFSKSKREQSLVPPPLLKYRIKKLCGNRDVGKKNSKFFHIF